MNRKWRWINIFARDTILILLMLYVNYRVSFQSWFAACIMGMLIVLLTWHFTDFLNYRRNIEE